MQSIAPRGGSLSDEAAELGQHPLIYNLSPKFINWNRWSGYGEDHRKEIDHGAFCLGEILPTILPLLAVAKSCQLWALSWYPVPSFVTVTALVLLPTARQLFLPIPTYQWFFLDPWIKALLCSHTSHGSQLSVLLLTLALKASIAWPSWSCCTWILSCQHQKVTVANLSQKEPIRMSLGSL